MITLYALLVIFVLINAAAMGLVVIGLPGNWVMVALTWGLALWQWDRHIFSLPVLIAIIVLAVIGEILESLTGAAMVRKTGGSKKAAVGAILGAMVFGIVGTVMIPIPVIGSILGACIGAFLGAMAMEYTGGQAVDKSIRTGVGAGIGHFIGINMKLIAGAIIWTTITISAFWP